MTNESTSPDTLVGTKYNAVSAATLNPPDAAVPPVHVVKAVTSPLEL